MSLNHRRSSRRPPEMTRRARRLRRDATFPERLLWSRLRARRFGEVKFRRQHVAGGYVVDFYCPECRLVIELDGHSHDTTASGDLRRERDLCRSGMTVLRFTNDQVLRNIKEVLTAIESAIVELRNTGGNVDPDSSA